VDHESNQIATISPSANQLAVVQSANPFLRMIEKAMEGGITEKSAEVMGKLVAVFREVEKDIAAKAHAAAMADLQAELPNVQARHAIKATHGRISSEYASYDDLMDQVHTAMAKYGFSVKYDAEHHGDKMTAICKMTHRGGHTDETRYTTRIAAAAGGNSASQADTGAMTTAKRVALCNALNIVVGGERDARAEGEMITADEADELCQRVHALCEAGHGTMDAWLALAGAPDWESVRSVKARIVRAEIEKAEKKSAVPACPATQEGWMAGVEQWFQTKGRPTGDLGKWLRQACDKRKATSYLALTPDQRAELWLLLHRAK
jgi:hypothetical protein